jgi:hypothetical protein
MPSAPRRSLPFSILAAGFDLYADVRKTGFSSKVWK